MESYSSSPCLALLILLLQTESDKSRFYSNISEFTNSEFSEYECDKPKIVLVFPDPLNKLSGLKQL